MWVILVKESKLSNKDMLYKQIMLRIFCNMSLYDNINIPISHLGLDTYLISKIMCHDRWCGLACIILLLDICNKCPVKTCFVVLISYWKIDKYFLERRCLYNFHLFQMLQDLIMSTKQLLNLPYVDLTLVWLCDQQLFNIEISTIYWWGVYVTNGNLFEIFMDEMDW